MTQAQDSSGPLGVYRVSRRGQFSLPARARKRWGLEDGGEVEVLDLGDCIVMFPGGPDALRRAVAEWLTHEEYADFVASIDDPDLQNV
jgi:bifunctional DNA-binding transcriptional regulator/antitoxin component of YhaV-PrlF toxin-antitoxin module